MAKREILFRGKVKGTGEWVYGNLIHRVDEIHVQESNELYISDYICEFDAVCLEYEVDSDTVGQYTGIKDAKGVKIFEGDIIVRQAYPYIIQYHEEYSQFVAVPKPDVTIAFYQKWVNECGLVVVGNVHEHSELIKTE